MQMRVIRKGICGAVLMVAAQAALANGLDEVPAETPPASYTAANYVDSRGCVFVRAGEGATLRWVPRVTRSLELVCGFRPSLAPGSVAPSAVVVKAPVTAPVVAPVVTPAPKPVVIPRGFKSAWSDGRLNTRRGPRTEAGNAAMAQVWTDDVPMVRK